MLKLYYFPFSNPSAKVRICLFEKGLDYESQSVNLFEREHFSEWYKEINPDCSVPALVHNDRVIVESNIILQYLEERFPHPALMPADPYLRSQVRLNFKYEESLLHDMFVLSFHWMIETGQLKVENIELPSNYYPDNTKRDFYKNLALNKGITDSQYNTAVENVSSLLQALDTRMTKNASQYVISDDFTLADIAWIAPMQRLELINLKLWETDNSLLKLKKWWEQMRQRESFLRSFD